MTFLVFYVFAMILTINQLNQLPLYTHISHSNRKRLSESKIASLYKSVYLEGIIFFYVLWFKNCFRVPKDLVNFTTPRSTVIMIFGYFRFATLMSTIISSTLGNLLLFRQRLFCWVF